MFEPKLVEGFLRNFSGILAEFRLNFGRIQIWRTDSRQNLGRIFAEFNLPEFCWNFGGISRNSQEIDNKIHETFGSLSRFRASQAFLRPRRLERSLDQTERCIRRMPRAERGPPARSGSEAPKARCTGRVRSVSDSYVHPNPDSSIPETTS